MARNVIRRSNTLEARRLTICIAALLVVTVLCLVFVFLQIRSIQLADEVKKLELSLQDIEKRNNCLQLEIERRTKPKALAEKVASFQLDLVGVSELQTIEAQLPAQPNAYRSYVQKDTPR